MWGEIEKAYSNKKRYYHNLSHLQNLLLHLQVVKEEVKCWDTVLFALFYHDIIYNALKKDNEEKSALLADKRLSELGFARPDIELCKMIILATKGHDAHSNSDINYFTDSDLCVLGSEWNIYIEYADNVRKEYAIFPDIIYKPGRRKVLEHFISMKQIFKTPYFFKRFEASAKNNLKKELELLS